MASKARSSRRLSKKTSSGTFSTATIARTRSNLLESLESRQLMAATSAKFNFQPPSSSIPSGYIADTGKSYSAQNGQTYGWNTNNTAYTRDRNTSADAIHDTFVGFGMDGVDRKWEVAVPNGTYNVSLTAGDASYIDSKYGLAVEGKTILTGTPTNSNHWFDASGTVTVTDGKLTLTNAGGSYNNKIAALSYSLTSTTTGGTTTTKPTAPNWISAISNSANQATVKWNDLANNESGYIIQRSTDANNWTEAARVGANITSFVVTGLTANTKYYFRVMAYNSAGNSAASPREDTTVKGGSTPTTPTTTTKPNAVTGLTVTASGSTAASLKWTDVANETGYRVQRSTDNSSFVDVTTLGANVVSYADSSLKASTKYYYRIQSFNNVGASTSSVVNATTATTPAQAPTAPSWFGAQSGGSYTANMQWGDVSNETGFIIEKSTNGGSSFTEHARVGANVTAYTATGLNSNTSYVFRVKAYNAAGTSAASMQQTIKTAASATPTTVEGASLPSGMIYSLSGVCSNVGTAAENINAMKAMGVTTVRVTYDAPWNNPSAGKWYSDQAKQYKAAGFKVMMVVLERTPTDAATAKRFYQAVASDASLRNAVDYWQVGNEPNINTFWTGSASQYVNTHLKPAYEALKAVGETVVGAGPSWDPTYAQQLVNAGYNNYCDFAAFHPYGNSAQESIDRAYAAKAVYGSKPLMFTEWSAGSGDSASWIAANNKIAAAISKISVLSFYYGWRVDSSRAGAGGIMSNATNKNGNFYNMMKDWLS